MISSATRGAGGRALGAHLANADHNERVEIQQSRGLLSESIREQIDELSGLASHARTRRPLYHVHLDPPTDRPLNPQERARYWEKFESEFRLSDRPFSSVIHEKYGREHEHRVYLAVKSNGRAVDFSHDYARREKLNRVFELERGEALTVGRHNRAVANALEREGRDDLAQRIQESGITDAPRPQAISPNERHQQERTEIKKIDVAQQVLTAWQTSDDGKSFANALSENGLTLAHGQKCAVVIDSTGNTHALGRLLNIATKEAGIERIPAPAVVERISTAEIPTVPTYQEYRAQQTTATPEKSQPSKAETGDSEVSARPRGGSLEPSSFARGGGEQGPAPQASQQGNPSPLAEIVGGPGEPPGKNASFDEKARYRKRLYEYDRLRGLLWLAVQRANSNQKSKITTPIGENSEPAQQEKLAGIEASDRIARLCSAPRPQRPESGNTRTAFGTRISRDISEARQTRTLREFVQRDRVGSELGKITGAPAPAHGAEPERDQHNATTPRPDAGTVGSSEQARKRANGVRFENRKIENTLKQILTPDRRAFIDRTISALAKPLTLEQIADKNASLAQRKIEAVLATRPQITANDLSRDFQRAKICGDLYDGITRRGKALERAEKSAQLAESLIPWWSKFAPWKTETEARAERATAEFMKLQTEIGQQDYRDRQKIASSGEIARDVTDGNRKTLSRWENAPEVRTATKSAELLADASASARHGHIEMRDLLAENRIREALELQRRIQEEQQQQAVRQTQKIAGNGMRSALVGAQRTAPRMR